MVNGRVAANESAVLSLSVTIGHMHGGAFSVTVLTSEDEKPVSVFCTSRREAALRAADVLASYSALLIGIAERESRPAVVLVN